jgi:uncharacterized protein
VFGPAVARFHRTDYRPQEQFRLSCFPAVEERFKLSPDKKNDSHRLALKVTPNAGRNEIVGFKEGVLHVKIGAPPDKGKANKELIDFLAETLAIRKSSIRIIKGETSHNKLLAIDSLSNEEILKRIS